MFIFFRIKALYVGAIALGISFIWTMVGFGIFGSSVPEELLTPILGSMWVFIFGLSILLVDLYWHLSDPNAVMFFALFSMKTWSVIIMLISIWAVIAGIAEIGGFDMVTGEIILFTLVSATLLVALYKLLKKRYLTKHEVQNTEKKAV